MKMKLLRWNNPKPKTIGHDTTQASSRVSGAGSQGNFSLSPVEGEIFSLTFPFIDQAMTLKTAIGSESTVRLVCASLAGAAPELLLFFSACKAQLLDC